MKETIVFAPGANGTELLRTLAKYNIQTFNMRVMGAVELAQFALTKSGKSITKKYINSKEQTAIIYSFIKTIPYFSNASYSDAEKLSNSINSVRKLILGKEAIVFFDKMKSGEFAEKNSAITDVYSKYIAKCTEENYIDNIGIIREAISNSEIINGDFVVLEEYPLFPIEKELLNKISKGVFSIKSLYGLMQKEEKKANTEYVEAYGSVNEAENIIYKIFEKKIPLDDCTVVCVDSTYPLVFSDLCTQYEIPMTNGCGIPLRMTKPAQLFKKITIWDTFGFNGVDALKEILNAECFDMDALSETLGVKNVYAHIKDIASMMGNLRISFDKNENNRKLDELYEVLKKEKDRAESLDKKKRIEEASKNIETYSLCKLFVGDFNEGIIHFLEKYSKIRKASKGKYDKTALETIKNEITAYTINCTEGTYKDIADKILEKNICSENSMGGHLHITSVDKALAVLRSNLFICGLSAEAFPGAPSENYLILDKDYKLFSSDKTTPTSDNIIKGKIVQLENLIKNAAAVESYICFSYSSYDLAELKDKNPSSLYRQYYDSENPSKEIKRVGYFDNILSKTSKIKDKYCHEKGEFLFDAHREELPKMENIKEKVWSPSALEKYVSCPRRFYLERIAGIYIDDVDNPLSIIGANTEGSILHEIMEETANKSISKADFIKLASDKFDDYLKKRPAVIGADVPIKKDEFLELAGNAFEQNAIENNTVFSCEEYYSDEWPNGIKLGGYPDRVEERNDGTLKIVDYKFGHMVKHEENDVLSCLQTMIYAWLIEKETGKKVVEGEYRYPRLNKIIHCKYDNSAYLRIEELLDEFKESLTTNTFCRNDKNCKYCKFGDICVWPER